MSDHYKRSVSSQHMHRVITNLSIDLSNIFHHQTFVCLRLFKADAKRWGLYRVLSVGPEHLKIFRKRVENSVIIRRFTGVTERKRPRQTDWREPMNLNKQVTDLQTNYRTTRMRSSMQSNGLSAVSLQRQVDITSYSSMTTVSKTTP